MHDDVWHRPCRVFSESMQWLLTSECDLDDFDVLADYIIQGRIYLVGGLGPSSLGVTKWETVKA